MSDVQLPLTPLRALHKALLWGIWKVNFQEILASFGDRYPQNDSKNEQTAPRTSMGHLHEGPRAEPLGHVLSRENYHFTEMSSDSRRGLVFEAHRLLYHSA